MQFLGNRQLLLLRQKRSRKKRGRVLAERKALHPPQKRLEGRGLCRQLVMIESRGCISGQRQSVGLIDSRVPARSVHRIVEAENRREQDDSIQIYVLQESAQNSGAWGPVGFAKQVFRGIPAIVLRQKAADEAFKSMSILIDPQKAFSLSFPWMRLKPAPGASINARSVASRRLY
jgi:hypothetical protein